MHECRCTSVGVHLRARLLTLPPPSVPRRSQKLVKGKSAQSYMESGVGGGWLFPHKNQLNGELLQPSSAFVLLVHLEFASREDSEAWIKAWEPLGAHCRDEPGCLTYDAVCDDGDGTRVSIVERYTCKADLTEIHQKSAPFLAFRAHPVQQLIKSKSGQSYLETNVGFTYVAEKEQKA